MKNTEQLENALRMVREADRETAAPDFLETRLRAAFREHHAAKKPRNRVAGFRWMWATTALAGFIVGAAVWRVAVPASIEAPQTPVAKAAKPVPAAPVEIAPSVPKQVVARAVKPRVNVVRPAPARTTAEPLQVTSAATHENQEFIAIPFAPPFTSQDRGEVVRTRLSRQSIRSLGIPITTERISDRMPADILIGEDGVARGIRILHSSEQR